MKNSIKIQELGNSVQTLDWMSKFPPVMDRKKAAECIGISVQTLRGWEKKGFSLGDSLPGFKKIMYLRANITPEKIAEKYEEWKRENPLEYADLQR